MATARTTTPRHDGKSGGNGGGSSSGGSSKKHKRSRSSSNSRPPVSSTSSSAATGGVSSADMEAVRATLAGLEKWQLAVNVDISEIRKECMRVRREVSKTEEQATLAQSAATASATDAEALRKSVEQQAQQVSAAVQDVQKEVHAVNETSTKATADADAAKDKLAAVERRLTELLERSIDEEYLMTQLSALQERYDAELVKCRGECQAMVQTKQREIDALEAKMSAMENDLRIDVAAADKRQAEAVLKLSVRVEEVEQTHLAGLQGVHEQLQADVEALKDQIYAVEQNLEDVRALTEEQLRAPPPPPPSPPTPILPPAVPLEAMQAVEDELRRVRDDMDAMKDQLFAAQRSVNSVRAYTEEQPRRPPPPDPRPIVPIEAFQAVEDKLRRMGSDLHIVASDYKRLTSYVDMNVGKLHDHFARRLEDLGAELFSSLSRDANSHIAEILRLKDAMFDMQGDIRTVRRTVQRLDERPADWSPLRGYDYPPARRHGEPHRYEPEHQRPPFAGRRRNRSRSRSRSPGRQRRRFESSNNQEFDQQEPQRWERPRSIEQDRYDARGDAGWDHSVGGDAGVVPPTEPAPANRIGDSDAADASDAADHRPDEESRPTGGENVREAPVGATHRMRLPRRQHHEVIVIEDEDEDEEEKARADVPPNMAPPDIVLEDDMMFNRDESHTGVSEVYNTVSPSPSEAKMHGMGDLDIGLLLYFCLGGAPDLDAAWTSHFYQMRNDECVEMPRALSFQRHHRFLQTLPMHLTQCVIQSVAVSGSASDDEDSASVDDLEPPDVCARFDRLVAEIRLKWTTAAAIYLEKEAAAIRSSADDSVHVSVNPIMESADVPSSSNVGLAVDWLKRQSSALLALVLARRRAIGSVQSLDHGVGASPAVHILLLMFDVVRVHTGIPQLVTLRLNAFGAELVLHLWSLLLARLPYLFFADWTWLEDQSEPKGELPPLGFCHLLAVILASNSLIDTASLSSEEVHTEAIELLFQALHVNGQSLCAMAKSANVLERCLPVGRAGSVAIELVNVDQRLVSTLALDGCFDVCAAVSSATE